LCYRNRVGQKDQTLLHSLSLENGTSLETHVLTGTCSINLRLEMNMSLETSLEIPLSLETSLSLPYQQPQRMPPDP
jgi:hypothetical protein